MLHGAQREVNHARYALLITPSSSRVSAFSLPLAVGSADLDLHSLEKYLRTPRLRQGHRTQYLAADSLCGRRDRHVQCVSCGSQHAAVEGNLRWLSTNLRELPSRDHFGSELGHISPCTGPARRAPVRILPCMYSLQHILSEHVFQISH